MKSITNQLLKSLAGTGAFERGQRYYEQGLVAHLKHSGNTITADVEGTEVWQVTLKHTARVFEGACDCPASENFDFCKHCVATAMVYRDTLAQQAELQGADTKKRLPTYLLSWEKQALVDLVLELLQDNGPRLQGLRIEADIAAGKVDEKALRKQITAAIPYNRQLFRHQQVRGYFQSVEAVLASLEPPLKALAPEKALKLIDYALTRIERALETIDDSGGYRFHAVELLNALHVETLQRSGLSPAQRADYLYSLYLEPVSDLYPAIPAGYSEVLGEQGSAHFLSIIRREWDRLPPLTSDDWEQKYRYLRLMDPLLKAAALQGDKAAPMALKAKIATGFRDFLELSKLCLENDDLNQALNWRRKAQQHRKETFHSESALEENQIDIWSYKGEFAAVLEMRWRQFEESASLLSYQRITAVPGADDVDAVKERALSHVRKLASESAEPISAQRALNTEAEILLHHQEAEAALALAEREKLDPDLLLSIAGAHTDKAERTLPLYLRVAASHARHTNNQSYREAIAVLESCRQQLPEKLDSEFLAGVEALREQFKQKRNFVRWLSEAFPESIAGR